MSIGILYVIGDLDRGGAETHLARVLPLLRERGITPTVQTLTHEGELAPVLRAGGVEVHAPALVSHLRRWPAGIRKPVILLVAVLSLLRRMLVMRPAAVHCFLPQAYLLGGICALLTAVPVRLMSRRSLNVYQHAHPILARIEHCLHRFTTLIVGNSAAVHEDLVREPGVNAQRVRLIYNGIDASRYRLETTRHSKRVELGISEDALVLIKVANLIGYKGHADLLTGLAAVETTLPRNWVLLCVGADGGVRGHLESQARELGLTDRIRWLGSCADVAQIQAAADVALLCSHQEGFSNAVLEGMACGLPMVVTDVGGNAEAVVDGETGLVVPPGSPADIGRAIATLANDCALREAYGAAGRRRVERLFSLEACVDAYLELYESVLSPSVREPR